MDKIKKICNNCGGYGTVSNCCEGVVHNNKCECGKFCKEIYCCEGYSYFEIGTKVEIFVCTYSSEYLKKILYNPKKHEDYKTFFGEVEEIINQRKLKVKIKYKKDPIEINIDDLEVLK